MKQGLLTSLAEAFQSWKVKLFGGSLPRLVWVANRYLEQRNTRERAMIGGALLLVSATIWYQTFFSVTRDALLSLERRIDLQVNANEVLARRASELESLQQMADDPDGAVLERISDVQVELESLNDRLVQEGLSFIAPAPMSDVLASLEEVIEAEQSAELVSIERTSGGQLFQSGDESGASWSISQRQVLLIFDADFRGAVRFLQAIEELPFNFAWEELSYEVLTHPIARVEVRLSVFAPEDLP